MRIGSALWVRLVSLEGRMRRLWLLLIEGHQSRIETVRLAKDGAQGLISHELVLPIVAALLIVVLHID